MHLSSEALSDSEVIFNADDYGASLEVNDAILASLGAGTIQSLTVLINLPASATTHKLVVSHPHVSIGLHANLTDGSPVSTPSSIPSLVDHAGRFLGWKPFWKRLVLASIDEDDILREISAQFRKLEQEVGPVSHLDTHQHIHIWPSVLRSLLKVGDEAGVRRVRTNRRFFVSADESNRSQARLRLRHALNTPISVPGLALKRYQTNEIRRQGFRSPEFMFTPVPNIDYVDLARNSSLWIRCLEKRPSGRIEVVCHPGVERRERELFGSVQFARLLYDSQIVVRNYLAV